MYRIDNQQGQTRLSVSVFIVIGLVWHLCYLYSLPVCGSSVRLSAVYVCFSWTVPRGMSRTESLKIRDNIKTQGAHESVRPCVLIQKGSIWKDSSLVSRQATCLLFSLFYNILG